MQINSAIWLQKQVEAKKTVHFYSSKTMNEMLIFKCFCKDDPVVLMGLCWSSLLDNQKSKVEFFSSPNCEAVTNILQPSADQKGADSGARGQINYPWQPFPLSSSDDGESLGPIKG